MRWGAPHFSKSFCIRINTFFLFNQPLEFAFWWWQAPELHFGSVTDTNGELEINDVILVSK